MQDKACLSRAACLTHPCKAYKFHSCVLGHATSFKFDLGRSGGQCLILQKYIIKRPENMTKPLESFALQLRLHR